MASRGHSWFDVEKLLPGERLARSTAARLRVAVPPYWWEGELILTSDRLFFLPCVESPLISEAAFWLAELTQTQRSGPRTLSVADARHSAQFQIEHPLLAFHRDDERTWVRDVNRLRTDARHPSIFDVGARRRAVG